MPVFPLVASIMVLPGTNAPLLRPASIIPKAGRSFTDPPGLNHSAFPQISTSSNSRPMLASRSRGVLPIRARMDSPTRAEENGALPVEDVDAIRFVANILDFGQWCGQILDAPRHCADITVLCSQPSMIVRIDGEGPNGPLPDEPVARLRSSGPLGDGEGS